jgi:hypothetical protein
MALSSDRFLENPTRSADGEIIGTIVNILDIMPSFLLKLSSKTAPSRPSGMNTFSKQRAAFFNYFFSTGIQPSPVRRFGDNHVQN